MPFGPVPFCLPPRDRSLFSIGQTYLYFRISITSLSDFPHIAGGYLREFRAGVF